MLKSMTAFGRANSDSPEGHFVAEIQSLNRKFLEVAVQLPRELSCLEAEVRRWVSSKIFRGKVTLKITATYEERLPISVVPNLPLARQMKAAWDKIGTELGADGFTLQMLAEEPGILTYSDDFNLDAYRNTLKSLVAQAIEKLMEMKLQEGKAILSDFSSRLSTMEQALGTIDTLKEESTRRYQEKLKKTIEEFLSHSVENEERILREICIYADKIDITEEITRFGSHIAQFRELLAAGREEKGKTLEFILQEMLREANTIGSKSDDVEITKRVITIKSEIEKLKEQVQNIE